MFTVQNDNDLKHTTNATLQWFKDTHLNVLERPCHSPDLSLIKNRSEREKQWRAKVFFSPTYVSDQKVGYYLSWTLRSCVREFWDSLLLHWCVFSGRQIQLAGVGLTTLQPGETSATDCGWGWFAVGGVLPGSKVLCCAAAGWDGSRWAHVRWPWGSKHDNIQKTQRHFRKRNNISENTTTFPKRKKHFRLRKG